MRPFPALALLLVAAAEGLGCGTIHDAEFRCGNAPPYCPPDQSCGGDGFCHAGKEDLAPPNPIVKSGVFGFFLENSGDHYLRTDVAHGTSVQVGWDRIGDQEKFTLRQDQGTTISIACGLTGRYVTAKTSVDRAPLSAESLSVGDNERFELGDRGDGMLLLYSVGAKAYVATDPLQNGDAFADRGSPSAAQGLSLQGP